MAGSDTVLLGGDVGAANARFGLASPDGAIQHSTTFADSDFATIAQAIRAYLAQSAAPVAPRIGCLAIAAPATGDEIRMTNHPWGFSVAALRAELGFERLEIINDFTAVALALPRLTPAERAQIGGGEPTAGRPIAVLGPGSGLGASGLVPAGSRWLPLTGEGGHVTMPAVTGR